MQRLSFIKSLAVLWAAPDLLAVIEKGKAPLITEKPARATEKRKLVLCLKVTERLISDEAAFLVAMEKAMRESGIDKNKKHTIKIGWVDDDFVKERKTLVVTQWVN